MEAPEIVGRLGRRDALQDARGRLDQRGMEAELDRDGGGLEPDVAAADDQRARAASQDGRHGVDIGERAQGENVAQRAAKAGRQGAGPRSRGKRELVVDQALAIFERHRPGGGIDHLHPGIEPQFDAVLIPETRGAQIEALESAFPQEIALGERRALVRSGRLLADQGYGAFMPERAQARGQRGAGLTGADDDDWPHGVSPFCCVRRRP